MIKLVAIIYLALNGVVDPEPARIVNSIFTFDTVEACEEFKKSEIGLRAEASVTLQSVVRLAETPYTVDHVVIACEDHTPKRDT